MKIVQEWENYDYKENKLKLIGFRWETDAEFNKRRDNLLKRREADRKRREEKKRQAAAAKKSAQEQEYQQYLELKKKYGDD